MQKFPLKKDPFYAREVKRYQQPIPSREYILSSLKKIGKAVDINSLAKAFSLRSIKSKDALKMRLLAMIRDGQLLETRRGSFVLVDTKLLIRGSVVGHRDGYGFVIPEDGGDDVFLPVRQMNKVFHGDRVLVQIVEVSSRGRKEGRIVEILERNTTHVVGRFWQENGVSFVVPENTHMAQDVLIPRLYGRNVKPGQLVDADIVTYPSGRRQATAKITEVLGEHMAPGMEIAVALRVHDLPHIWSDKVTAEQEKVKENIAPREIRRRKDLRHLPFVTIDGEDAKDFDDAVFCEIHQNGGWRLYVAIADVSHYVKPDTALDKEALARGNSIYFPNEVIPMLPEKLSNGICSLNPNVDRLVMVCEMVVGADGKITRYRFYEGVICSHARKTYTEVAAELELDKNSDLFALYKALYKQRSKRGAIDFDKPETKIIFDDKRKVKDIVPIARNSAHWIIEECMLAANVCAARFLTNNKIPALYRVHEPPDAEKLDNLRGFLGVLGLQLKGGDDPQPADMSRVLKQIQKRPDKYMIQDVLLRSMRQAIYTEDNVGHFGLAYEAYAHFTSPIRRYPDLLTHRAIKHALYGGTVADFEYDSSTIHNFGEHCCMTERRADDATYDVINWLKCEYMQKKMGAIFPGVISSVCGFGIFVELKEIYIEGLVHISSLPNDFYHYDVIRHSLIGKSRGKTYRLGDFVLVRVVGVNLDERKIDFELVTK